MRVDALALGLAAVGRPAYINLGRDQVLPRDRTVPAMRAVCWAVLDAAYEAGVRWVDAARSYGRSEQFLAEWLTERGYDDVTVSSKWGYAYVGDWRMDAPVHEEKEHSLTRFRRQWNRTRELLGDRVSLYQVHSLTADSPLFTDRPLVEAMAELAAGGVRLGFSTSGPKQGDTVRRALELTVQGQRLFGAVQATWNVLEPSVAPALAEATESGVRVMLKEVLANGRLAVAPPGPVAELAARYGVGPDAVAIAAASAQPWADPETCLVLLGAAGPTQVKANLDALSVRLGEADLAALTGLATDPVDYWRRRSGLPWS